jgi:ATP-dependent protease ClpP protease subunit
MEEIELKSTKNTVWDDYVPIVTRDVFNIDMYLTDTIEYPATYNKLVHTLTTAEEHHTINIYINNGGGYVDSALYIIDAIKKSKAQVIAHLSGTVASSATIITMACDEVVCAPYLSFMIHNYSTGIQGKGHEVKAQQTFSDKELNRAFRDIYRNFLTEEEMNKVIEGTDIWLNEIDVMTRWENKKVINEKEV